MTPNRQGLMSGKERTTETVFEKNKRREAEIAIARKEEQARREAVLKNMHRLRSLRLAYESGAPAK